MRNIRFWLAIVLFHVAAADAVELKILTDHGYVAFAPGDDWPVISTQTHLPVAVMAFQIPNAADEGTPDSTNLSISLYDLGTERGRDAFARSGAQLGLQPPSVENIGAWRVIRQESTQGATSYTILDAQRSTGADVAVSVRLAWPHLASNRAAYDAEMEAILRGFISSVHGEKGPYTPKDGEVIRRPGN
jgi:hypothetical protein